MSTCALIAASPECNIKHFAAQTFDFVIAVDGGFAYLENEGLTCDMVLGDFDSLGYEPKHHRVATFPKEKDFSDLDNALSRAVCRGCDSLAIYGALGGRLDHTLNNIQAAACVAEQGVRVDLIGLHEQIHLLAGPDVYHLPEDFAQAHAGEYLSVLALSATASGVIEEGLKYALAGAEVTNRKTWGLSNEFMPNEAFIALEKGTLAIIHPIMECLYASV